MPYYRAPFDQLEIFRSISIIRLLMQPGLLFPRWNKHAAKGRVVLVHAMKKYKYKGTRGTTPLIPNLGNRYKWKPGKDSVRVK